MKNKVIDEKISSSLFGFMEERDFCKSDLLGAFIISMDKYNIKDYERFYVLNDKKYKVMIQEVK